MDDIKKQVSKKKKEGDSDFKRGKISFAAEAYRSALRLINSTKEAKSMDSNHIRHVKYMLRETRFMERSNSIC